MLVNQAVAAIDIQLTSFCNVLLFNTDLAKCLYQLIIFIYQFIT
jgi:hypothetical protein